MNYQLALEKGEEVKPDVTVTESVEQATEVQTEQPEQVEQVNLEKSTSKVETSPVKQPETEQETIERQHFKKLRIAREQAERERDDALRRLQEYEQSSRRAAAPQPDSSEEELLLGNDELAEGKHLRKVNSKVDRKISELEKKLNDQIQRNSMITTEVKLRSELPDFDRVVSEENIEILKETHPELAYSLEMTPDMYSKAKAAYKIIKSMGIYRADNYQQDRAKVQANTAKPRPVASIAPQTGDSPLSRANAFDQGLTDELRTQLIKEMEAARRSL